MLKRIFVAAPLMLALAVSLNAYQDDWVKLAPVGGGFSIMMPVKAEEDTNSNDHVTLHIFKATTEKTVYVVVYGDYAPSLKIEPEAELIADRDNFLKSLNATLVSSKKITLDGHAGLEFTGENDRALLKSRVYVLGNRVHQIGAALIKGQDDSENFNRFFDSFTFASNQDHTRP